MVYFSKPGRDPQYHNNAFSHRASLFNAFAVNDHGGGIRWAGRLLPLNDIWNTSQSPLAIQTSRILECHRRHALYADIVAVDGRQVPMLILELRADVEADPVNYQIDREDLR